jgi:hypothetical protein
MIILTFGQEGVFPPGTAATVSTRHKIARESVGKEQLIGIHISDPSEI